MEHTEIVLKERLKKPSGKRSPPTLRPSGRKTPHTCEMCHKTFPKLRKLKVHMMKHTGIKPHVCSVCGKGFSESRHLKEHSSTHELERTRHECLECGKTFLNYKSLVSHQKVHTGIGMVSCPVCNKMCMSNSRMKEHLMRHTGEKITFSCEICGKELTSKKSLMEHSRIHTGEKPHICDFCGIAFRRSGNLRLHLKRKHSPRDPGSQHALPTSTTVLTDWLEEQERGEVSDHEEILGQDEVPRQEVSEHEVSGKEGILDQEKPLLPALPNASYMCDVQLLVDADENENGQEEGENGSQLHPCNMCNKTFGTRRHLMAHRRRHLDGKPFTCNVCNAKVSRGYWRQHLKTHETDRKKFQCTFCDRTFLISTNLRTHMRVHTGQGLFPCLVCDKKFINSTRLRKHMRRHTGERDKFPCELCGKEFTKKTSVVFHMRLHTGERPYACQLCPAAFVCLFFLKRHLQKKHSGSETAGSEAVEQGPTSDTLLKSDDKGQEMESP